VRDVVHHVLQGLRPVGATHQRAELGADFALAGGGDFVVMHFDRHADGLQRQHHGGADVVEAIDRGNREVAALDARTVADVAAFELLARSPRRFFRGHLDVGAGHVDGPFDGVENEEFRFRPEVGGVADAGALEISLGALGDGARVAVVALAVGRFDDVAGQHQRGFVVERVDEGGFRVGEQNHVGGLNAFPARDRRAVEHVAVLENFFLEGDDGHADVLFLATGVGETVVDEANLVFLDQLRDVLRGSHDHS